MSAPSIRKTDRAVAPVVSHAMALGIMAIIVASLLIAANGVFTDEQDHADRKQLKIIGNRLADELSRASQLAQDGGNVSITTHHQQLVGGESYSVALQTGSTCDSDLFTADTCLELSLTRSGKNVLIPVNNKSRIRLTSTGSGTFTVSATSNGGSPPQQDPAVNLERHIGIGQGIKQYGSGQSVNLTNRNPIAGFTFTPGQPSVNTIIHFENETDDLDGVIDTYEWDLDGDGTTDRTGREFDYSYSQPGRYTVTLTVTDDDGDTASVSKIISVSGLVYKPPTSDISRFSPHTTEESLMFDVENKHSAQIRITEMFIHPENDAIDELYGGDEIVIDGSSDDHTEPYSFNVKEGGYIHILDEEGDQDETILDASATGSIQLNGFRDGGNEVDMTNEPVFVAIRYEVAGEFYTSQFTLGSTTINYAPDVSFTVSCTDSDCSFDGSGSSDPDGGTVSYEWDFGDGANATGATPSHTYSGNGTFDVSLTVTDDEGVSSILTKSVVVGTQQRWYNTGWDKRKPITIKHSKVSGDLTGFPVLISITDDGLESEAQANGNDIMFTQDDGTTKLAHEIESYDDSTGELLAWVNVTEVSDSSNTTIYMYYGNSGASNQENVPGVWGPEFSSVWHLEEDPSDGVAGFEDSTSNDNTGMPHDFQDGGYGSTDVDGYIGGGVDTGGWDEYIETDDELATLRSTATLSTWIRLDRTGSSDLRDIPGIAGRDDYSWFGGIEGIHWGAADGDGNIAINAQHYNYAISDTDIESGSQWYHVVFTRDSATGQLEVYIDGTLEDTQAGPSGDIPSGDSFSGLGRIEHDGWANDEYLDAGLDEIRISDEVRSEDWIETSFENQHIPSSFYVVGDEQALYQESSGQVVMEAEDPMAVQPGNDKDEGPSNGDDMSGVSWSSFSDGGASNGTALDATPDAGDRSADDTENGERLDYYVDFSGSDTFYVWVRMKCSSNSDDGVHVGLNGTPLTYGGDGLDADATQQCHNAGGWVWVSHYAGTQLSIDVPTGGPHTVNLWMVDDGVQIDKIVLKTTNLPPSGTGPSESPTS